MTTDKENKQCRQCISTYIDWFNVYNHLTN